jgi:hypothetical protein
MGEALWTGGKGMNAPLRRPDGGATLSQFWLTASRAKVRRRAACPFPAGALSCCELRAAGPDRTVRSLGAESMKDLQWDAAAQLLEREDSGSDMFYGFRTLKSGSLADLVAHVMALPTDQRERVVIDAVGVGSLNIHDIGQLAERDDFPGK